MIAVRAGRTLLAVAALALVLAAPAAARPFELGFQDDPLIVRDPAVYRGTGADRLVSRTHALRTARRLRMRVVRLNVFWDRVEQPTGVLDFHRYDRAVEAILAAGLEPQLTLTGPAPGGAVPDPAAYARLCAAAAARWRGRVKTYAIWNEPNWEGYLPADRPARRYRALFEAGSGAIRAVDPRARVLLGELAPMGRLEAAIPPLRFLRDTLRAGSRPLVADGVALHPYTLRWRPTYPGPGSDDVTTGSLRRLVRVLRSNARRGSLRTPAGGAPPIYLTEYGFHARSRRIAEPRRSAYVQQGLELARRVPQVRQVIWYQLAGPPPDAGGRIWDTALLDSRGFPRPVYAAVAAWARRHLRRTPIGGTLRRGSSG